MEFKFPWHSSISWHPFTSWYSILNKIHLILELNNSQQHLFGSWVQFSTTLVGFLSSILNNAYLILKNFQVLSEYTWMKFKVLKGIRTWISSSPFVHSATMLSVHFKHKVSKVWWYILWTLYLNLNEIQPNFLIIPRATNICASVLPQDSII
jgi:hypothetical protein